jgi:adenine C2-methylase RlmN of 23S rRNA A2503 and tRNA A37
MKRVVGLEFGELESHIAQRLPSPKYLSRQIWDSIYRHGLDFPQMTSISKANRQVLKEEFSIYPKIAVSLFNQEKASFY